MRCVWVFMAALFLGACSVEVPRDEYVAYFDKNCKTEVDRSGTHFFALGLTPDYERAKWGAPLDSGMRVVVGATPRSDLSFESALLVKGGDTLEVVLTRRMQTFEVGSADMFILGFAGRLDGAELYLRNVGHGIGGVKMKLKDCNNIRLEKK